MDLQTSKSFLRCLGVAGYDDRRNGWVTCACPLAPWRHPDGSGKSAFGLKLGAGRVFVKCFSCDYHGTPLDLLYELRDTNKASPSGKVYDFGKAMGILNANPADLVEKVDSLDELAFNAKPTFVYPEDWLAEFEPAYSGDQVHPYLVSRQMPYEVARDLDIRYDNVASRVCFPIRDYNGQLRGLHGRSVWPHVELKYLMYTIADPERPGQKHCNPDVWLGEAWVDPEQPVVIAESVFDLARVYQVYRNVMCPLMASLNEAKMKRLLGISRLVTMFDADNAGKIARDKLRNRFPAIEMHNVVLPAGFKDPGSMAVEDVAALLDQYVILDPILLHNAG